MFEPETTTLKLRKLGARSRRGGLTTALRDVKMLTPSCPSNPDTGFEGCQDRLDVAYEWWKDCPHDPYYTDIVRVERTPVFQNEEDGSRTVIDYTERHIPERKPNLSQVALSIRQNSGRGIEKARRHGWILPEEHPSDPLAPFCQFSGCWSQDLTVKTPIYGDYCTELQAKAVAMDQNGKTVEVLDGGKRADQLRNTSLSS